MDNDETKKNELDNPTEQKVPATTAEIMDPLKGFDPEQQRKKNYITKELVKLEHQAWEHDDAAEYAEATMLPPIDQEIEKNSIAIDRHKEIIDEITKSGSTKREDRERRKASESDIKLLEKDNISRAQLKAQIVKMAEGRRAQATEVRIHMKFLAEKYANLFKE